MPIAATLRPADPGIEASGSYPETFRTFRPRTDQPPTQSPLDRTAEATRFAPAGASILSLLDPQRTRGAAQSREAVGRMTRRPRPNGGPSAAPCANHKSVSPRQQCHHSDARRRRTASAQAQQRQPPSRARRRSCSQGGQDRPTVRSSLGTRVIAPAVANTRSPPNWPTG